MIRNTPPTPGWRGPGAERYSRLRAEPRPGRSVLAGSIVVAGGTVLGACTGSSSKGGGGAAGAPAGSGSSASAPAPASSPGAAGFRSGCSGVEWDLEAGPAVVRDGMTILRLSFSPVSENSVSLGTRVFSTSDSSHVIGEIKLLSLAGSAVYPVIGGDAHPLSKSVSPGESVELFPVFGAVPQDAGTVEVFLPNFGVVAGIPVAGEAEAGFDVAAALSGADPDTGKAGPYSIVSAKVIRRASGRISGRRYYEGCSGSGSERVPRV